MAALDPITLARFWSKVDVGFPAECWPWRAQINENGYGVFQGGKAHRTAFQILKGPIPDGEVVCHRCDNPVCCNPDHLFAGTQLDNVRDMIAKGRNRNALGERHHRAKLTDKQVAEIRASDATGAQLAKLYGVAQSTISGIRSRKHRRVSSEEAARVVGVG